MFLLCKRKKNDPIGQKLEAFALVFSNKMKLFHYNQMYFLWK